MHDAPSHVGLAEFARTWGDREPETAAFAVPSTTSPLPHLADATVRRHLEELLDTVVALQRGEWLQEGVYVGPRSMPDVYDHVLESARTLRIAVPPAILTSTSGRGQGALGTDDRPFLHLSSFFFTPATAGERRFVTGRLCGHCAARQVTWTTLYALVVDHNGLRRIARRNLGPTLEVFLAPLSLGARLVLSRWHRLAEVNADRAGLVCARDLDAAGLALLRETLGVRPDVSPEDYLAQNRQQRGESSPSRWTELLATRPFLYKRMQALELFARSEVYAELTGLTPEAPLLDRAELDRRTLSLLQVHP